MDKDILVWGPESSGTRMVSKLIASSLNIIPSYDSWNGHWKTSSSGQTVYHRSIPHHKRTNFVVPSDIAPPHDLHVVICVRDINIMIRSAGKTHNDGDMQQADRNTNIAASLITDVIHDSDYEFSFFHYEAALFLGQSYLDHWVQTYLGLDYADAIDVRNENKKYIADE